MKKPKEILEFEKKYNIVLKETDNKEDIKDLRIRNLYLMDVFGEVVGLNLNSNLFKEIPKLDDFKDLKVLNLFDNQITKIEGLENLIELNTLALGANHITKIEGLENLIELNTLALGANHITKIEGLENLSLLKKLYLQKNQITKIEGLENLKQLNDLYLNYNQITKIEDLENLIELNTLSLRANHITKIEGLENLTQLKELNLYNNQITKIEGLENLIELNTLSLGANHITKIEGLENLTQLNQLRLHNNQITKIEGLENLKQLNHLSLNSNKITKIEGLENLAQLSELYLFDNQITKIDGLENLILLKDLSLSNNEIIKIEGLKNLTQLNELRLQNNQITKIEGLENLAQLSELYLFDNQITKIEGLENLTLLKDLNLSYNRISKIEGLENLKQLNKLSLESNQITKIEGLENLKQLNILLLDSNKITNIEKLESLVANGVLERLHINNNPFLMDIELILFQDENHLITIKNHFAKKKEQQEQIFLPVKIMLLGNHASGKSAFLHYYQKDNLNYPPDGTKEEEISTHILKIKPIKADNESKLPKAIFFDFGGQDYYHGIYKAFFSLDSINLLFWHHETDVIKDREDSNTIKTLYFHRNYWLGYLDYSKNIMREKCKDKTTEPLLMVQTHADIAESRQSIIDKPREDLVREYFVSLQKNNPNKVNGYMLKALKEELNAEIEKKYQPQEKEFGYEDFLAFILKSSRHNATPIKDLLPHYKRKDLSDDEKIIFLKDDLQQRSRNGLVLYHKDNEEGQEEPTEKLEDFVWLNPQKTVEYIHKNILSKDIVSKNNGILTKEQIDGLIKDDRLKELLIREKILFYDKEYNQQYIVPNYLPLAKEDDENYSLMVFGFQKPCLAIKFERFIPFGFINQLICEFGKNPDKKHYWRDQLVFTYKDCKVWIKLIFKQLKLEIYLHPTESVADIKTIERELLDKILCLYQPNQFSLIPNMNAGIGFETLQREAGVKEEDIKQGEPRWILTRDRNKNWEGIYLSKDNINFISLNDLENEKENTTQIEGYLLPKEDTYLNKDLRKSLPVNYFLHLTDNENYNPINNFLHLTDNKNNNPMKKVFISYSHEDSKQRDRLMIFLKQLERDKKIQIWQDLKLKAGEEHEKEILDKLEQADIVILLVSQDFVASDFIYDKELYNAMKKKLKGNASIVPIVISASNIFDLELEISSEEKEPLKIKMGNYYFLPQDENNNLKPILNWGAQAQQDEAWMKVYEHIKTLLKMHI